MTRRRWIADEFSGDRAALTGAHAAHLSRTLRARVGQQFEVACGDQVRRATVSSVQDERVEFTLGEDVVVREPIPVTLLLAVFKFDRMEWAIEKCTELNVTAIVPVIARRTEKHLALAADKRVERWRRIAREAAEQSRRIAPPEISDPVKLSDVLAPAIGKTILTDQVNLRAVDTFPDLRIVLAESEQEALLVDALRAPCEVKSLSLAIGPEGGWTEEESQSFAASRWMAASLGDSILRAETAAIAAIAIVRAELQNSASRTEISAPNGGKL
jgi:16S rRNA (uracil1498-N3)-methyltransferase